MVPRNSTYTSLSEKYEDRFMLHKSDYEYSGGPNIYDRWLLTMWQASIAASCSSVYDLVKLRYNGLIVYYCCTLSRLLVSLKYPRIFPGGRSCKHFEAEPLLCAFHSSATKNLWLIIMSTEGHTDGDRKGLVIQGLYRV